RRPLASRKSGRDDAQRRHHLPCDVVRDRQMMDGIGPIRVLVLETEPEAANHARDALSGDERMLLVGTVTDQGSLLDKLGATYAQVAVADRAGLGGRVTTGVHELGYP